MPRPGLQRVRLTAPSGGLDVDSAPSQEAPNKALKLQNYLTGEPGRVRQRGPLTVANIGAAAGASANGRYTGMLPGNDKLLVGYRKADGTRVVEPHVAPRRNATGAQLAQAQDGTNELKVIDLIANSAANLDAGDRVRTPSWAWTRMGNFVYSIAYDSDNDTVDPTAGFSIGTNDRGGKQRLTRLQRWDVTGSAVPAVYTYGPYGMQDIRVHYNRLFALGGRHPNTIGPFINTNRIWYTRNLSANHHDYGFSPNDAFTGGTVPDDSDNSVTAVSPDAAWNTGASATGRSPAWGERDAPTVYNSIDLPWEEDFGVCFASVGRNLAIFKRRYILVLQGFAADTFELRTAMTGIGCLDPRSVVEANEGAYFLSQAGFMFFDGVRVHDASGGVKRQLLDAGLTAVGDEGQDGGFAIAERLDRDFLMLTIGTTNAAASPGTPTVTFSGFYHIPSNSWSTFTSATMATTGSGPIWLARTENRFAIFDHVDARVATKLTTPEQATEAQRGIDNSGNTIETKWHSKVVELASPFEAVRHQRIIVDYEWVKDEATADIVSSFNPDTAVTNRPRVQICNGAGTVVQTFYLPMDGNSGTESRENLRQRFVYDYFSEATEVQVRIEYPSTNTATALVACSIQDVWIEYQIAQQRRNTPAVVQ